MKKDSHLLTNDELEQYRLECIDLRDKCEYICSHKPISKDDMKLLLKYGKRLNDIKKILKKANKKVS